MARILFPIFWNLITNLLSLTMPQGELGDTTITPILSEAVIMPLWLSTDHNYISLHASCPMASCDWFGFLFHFHVWRATTRKYWLSNLIWIIRWCGIWVNDRDNKDIDDLGMERQPWVFHKFVPRPSLKALFNMFSLLKIWAVCPYMLSVSLIRCKNEALKNLHLKSTIKCFKQVKIDIWLDYLYSFLPIDCCVGINGEPDHLLSGDIQS